MPENERMQLFEDQPIRTAWDEQQEEWYFSVVDVVRALTGSSEPRRYWSDLKRKMKSEGAVQLYENIVQLKLMSSDGKRYKTDVATTEQLLRIIQSIPSPKAEPLKAWLAQVGRERIDETLDPELIAERLIAAYERRGYTREWINQRLQAISARKELTDEWKDRGVTAHSEYAILTDEITRAWSGMSTRQYKNLKGLKKESLRDNMSTLELALNMLAEAAATEISKEQKPEGFAQNRKVARQGGEAAKAARESVERSSGKPAITAKNAAQLGHVVTVMVESSAKDALEREQATTEVEAALDESDAAAESDPTRLTTEEVFETVKKSIRQKKK